MALSTKNNEGVKGGGQSKTIAPGKQEVKLNNIVVEDAPWGNGDIIIKLEVESRPVEGEFEGFLVNKDDQNGPRYKGKVGTVKAVKSCYAAKSRNGSPLDQEKNILALFAELGDATDNRAVVDGITDATNYEEFAAAMINSSAFEDKYFTMCVAGREYKNKAGYVNFDLYVPYFSTKKGFGANADDVIDFDSLKHIQKLAPGEGLQNNSFTTTSADPAAMTPLGDSVEELDDLDEI